MNVTNFYRKNRDICLRLFVFWVCFLPRIIINLYIKSTPGGHDDLGTLIVPSILAGYNWSGLVQDTAYYGFGYSILYTPFLVLFKNNSYLMFQAIFAVNAFFQSLMALLIYTLLVRHYKKCKDIEAVFISIASSYLVFTSACKIANDVVLPLITWILVWILTVLMESLSYKKRNLLTFLLVVVLGYSLILHSRSIVYWIGIVFTIILIRIIEHKWIVNMKLFVITGMVSYLFTNNFVELVQTNIWVQTDKLTNSTGVIKTMLELGFRGMFNSNAISVFISIIFGNLFAVTQYTYCFFIFGIVGFVLLLFRRVSQKNSNIVIEENKKIFVTLVFSSICFFIMYGGLCISYVYPAIPAYENKTSYSGFFYIRYYYNFAMPIVTIGMLLCTKIAHMKKRNEIIASVVLLFSLSCTIVTKLLGDIPLRDYWTSFGAKISGNDQTILSVQHYLLIYLVTCICFLTFIFLQKHFKCLALVYLTILCFHNYAYQNINSAKNWADNYIAKTNSFEEEILNKFDFKDEQYYIYVPNRSAAYGLQLRKVDYTIYNDLERAQKKKVLCIKNSLSKDMIEQGYMEIILSDDEVLYVNDKDVYDMIMNEQEEK